MRRIRASRLRTGGEEAELDTQFERLEREALRYFDTVGIVPAEEEIEDYVAGALSEEYGIDYELALEQYKRWKREIYEEED